MTAHLTGIDHLLIDVPDLEEAARAWRRLGFRPTPRGRHPQWGTGNTCLMLERDYVELIGVVDAAEFEATSDRRGRKLGRGGLAAIALASDDVEAASAELEEAGVTVDGPKDLSRLLEGEEGTEEPRFRLLDLPEASPAIPMFVCHHLTPELLRRPGWTDHDNAATAIADIALAVADPEACVPAYETLFGPGAVTRTDGLVTLRVGRVGILLAPPDELGALYPELLPEPGEGPMPAVVTLEVADLSRTEAALTAGRVGFLHDAEGLQVAPEDASGVALLFRPAA